jgi:outer membrane receptor protein involved in Fe transport
VDPVGKKSQIETGLKQIWRRSDALTDHFDYDEEQSSWVHDDLHSNNFDYHQNVLGVYLTYQLKLKKGLFKTGLRAENTVNNGFYKSVDDTSFSSKMFNLVPYVLLNRDFEKGKSLKLSYTNRLSRPGIWYLNPYYNDANPLNISIGNPKLETEISHSFDFSFNKFSDKINFSLNMNASFSNNLIYDVSVVKPDGVRITTYDNIGDDHNIGGTAYASVKVTDKLTVNTTVGLIYRNISSNNDLNLQNSGWGKSGKFNFFIKPWKNANILTGAGVTPRYYALQSVSAHHFWSYITYQHDFFDKKLRLETRLDMPFNKYRKYDSKAFNPSFYETTDTRLPARFLTFRFSWSFGQMKDSVKKAKRSISNDDVKQGG